MGVMESGSDATPETITRHLETLATALKDRGLVAEPFGARMVWAKNAAADPPANDTGAVLTSPGLRQTVACQRDDSGQLAWFWVWAGPTREAPPELEHLCLVENIDLAANRIARVLCLGGTDPEPAS